ncbi:hypothetical protein [Actinotalea subterranea]|uniref:hypothetical protein n=1 Tax=Actinotalea subterranea TaxID=2607497 RepID=UPI0011ED6185|nr:hypothetical protein [Actinotalea subterranea]
MDGQSSRRWAWVRETDGSPSSKLFEAIVAGVAVVGLVLSIISLVLVRGTPESEGPPVTSVTNNYYTQDGAPGEASPAASRSCGDPDSGVVGGWGPDRPVFLMAYPPTYTTFNSIRDNPNLGDERGFMRVRDVSDGVTSTFDYQVEVEDGHTYRVSIYVENSALDDVGGLAATDTVLKINLPTCDGHRIAANAFLSSPTAFPGEVWGGITFTSEREFTLAYVAGSAKIESNAWPGPDGYAIGAEDDLFTSTGVPLGYTEMDGVVPTGYEYAMYISFEVKPQF